MDTYQQVVATIALTMGSAWASGINLYATIGMLGFLAATGNIVLPEQLEVLQNPLVIGAAGLMYMVEFFADKTPGVDTGWDTIHSFIRIPAGAMLAAGAVGEVSPALVVTAGILGGAVSGTSHALKSGSRVLINTSPEPFSNWTASIVEDIAVIGGIWAALHHPAIFLVLFVLFILLAIYLIPKLIKGIRAVFNAIMRIFRNPPVEKAQPEEPQNAAVPVPPEQTPHQ
jgi:hypothetical protein